MPEKNSLLRGALVLIIALVVLEALAPTVMTIDTSTLADWQVKLVLVVQHFFRVTPVALLGGFAWALFGFLRYNFGDPTVQYEVDRLYQTWMWFEGMIIILAIGLPIPYSVAMTGIIMAVKSVLNALKAPTATEPPKTTAA